MKRNLFYLLLLVFSANFSFAQLESNVDLPFYNNYDGANDEVYRIKKQSDGKILIGGLFTQVGSTPFNSLARLNSDGTIDNTFSIGTGFNGPVYAIAIQADGKIVVGGSFSQFNGSSALNIARLNSDGSHDNTFTPFCNAPVYDIAIQNDGKIVVVGDFTTFNGSSANRFIRLLSTGVYDNTLNTSTLYANGTIRCVAINSFGNIQLGGDFSQFGGVNTPKYAVVTPAGGIGGNFGNPMGFVGSQSVRVIRNMSDGGFLVAGNFGIMRTTLSGPVTMPTIQGTVLTVEEDGWGRLYVGGDFGGGLMRITSSHQIDVSFPVEAGFNGRVNSGALLGDSIYLTGGSYSVYKSFTVDNAAPIRLISNCPPTAPTAYINVQQCNPYLGPDGNTYDQSGTYTFNTYSSTGCDSIIVAEVLINPTPAPTGANQQTFCTYNGATNTVSSITAAVGSNIQWYLSQSGGTALAPTAFLSQQWYYASQTINGCESIDRLGVYVYITNPTPPTTLEPGQGFCTGATIEDLTGGQNLNWYTADWGGSPLSPSTLLTDGATYFASKVDGPCESQQRVPVTVQVGPLDLTVTQDGFILTSNQYYASYQWIDCNNNNAPIQFETLQSYNAINEGSYAVIVSLPNCSDTSACFPEIAGFEENSSVKLLLNVHPNPASDNVTIETSITTSAQITSSSGAILAELELNNETTVDVSSYAPGVYFIRTAEGQTVKFVKE